ncbi:MAG: RNase adapter RapZ [Endomicrobiales bacterium]|nr:RNase adapter RapZ [Endomicrobiales bacterium]
MLARFYIITGLSGAGKSQALKILEDFGFFCVDNLPIELVKKFSEIELKGRWGHIAVGIDVRAGEKSLSSLKNILSQLKNKGIIYKIIFFTANDTNLLQRYSETRRRHPLGKRVIDGIKKERRLMTKILEMSDKEIDTSHLNLGELKEIMAKEMKIKAEKNISMSIISFGYRNGIPIDSDLIIDVRFLPNPNYIPKLRYKTGQDIEVKRYIEKTKMSKTFFNRFFSMLKFLLPNYVKEGKSYLTLAIGCTGGRHRSVMVAEKTAKFLKSIKYPIHIYHRDIDRT